VTASANSTSLSGSQSQNQIVPLLVELVSGIKTLATEVSAIKKAETADVAALEEELVDLRNKTAEWRTVQEDNSATQKEITEDLKKIDNKVTSNEDSINTNREKLIALSDKAAEDIKEMDEKVTSNKDAIKTNRKKINRLE